MPELPELAVLSEKLEVMLKGQSILWLKVYNHLVIHGIKIEDFEKQLKGMTFTSIRADGKFVLMNFENLFELVVNPMLAGRFHYIEDQKAPMKTTIFLIRTESGTLLFNDRKQMSRVYLVKAGFYDSIAGFLDRGPSALDESLTLDKFRKRLRRRNGQIKNVLRNQKFVKGIGNAYADEILLYAGIIPFRKRSSLSDDEIERLYSAMRTVLMKYQVLVSKKTLKELATEKRDFLMIHGKGGGICPLCGGRISEITSNRFKTNYCQTCQK